MHNDQQRFCLCCAFALNCCVRRDRAPAICGTINRTHTLRVSGQREFVFCQLPTARPRRWRPTNSNRITRCRRRTAAAVTQPQRFTVRRKHTHQFSPKMKRALGATHSILKIHFNDVFTCTVLYVVCVFAGAISLSTETPHTHRPTTPRDSHLGVMDEPQNASSHFVWQQAPCGCEENRPPVRRLCCFSSFFSQRYFLITLGASARVLVFFMCVARIVRAFFCPLPPPVQ